MLTLLNLEMNISSDLYFSNGLISCLDWQTFTLVVASIQSVYVDRFLLLLFLYYFSNVPF